jgi:hypothetical protein
LRCALLVPIVLILSSARAGAADEPAPLGNEDIVRMITEGKPHDEILAAIKTRAPAYDLSEEMVDELKIAGVPADVLAAMRARVEQAAPKAPLTARAPKGSVHLVVELSGAGSLRAPGFADEELKARFQLPKELEARQIRDLAVFLACVTPEHVPDLWRQKSPLGRDMNLTVRHEMLRFVPGATPSGKKPKLAVPKTLEADVDELEPHDLVVGVAALIGDHWIQVGGGLIKKVKAAELKKPLDARISAKPVPLTYDIAVTLPGK